MNKKQYFSLFTILLCCIAFNANAQTFQELKANFVNPPDNARPGVYWYFMDGNMYRPAITDDLEAMKKVGIGSVLFFDVNLGIPKHGVEFFSPEWIENVAFIMSECDRLGMQLKLSIGPGWTGSGGPWVKPEESMRHLVCSKTTVSGGENKLIKLAKPAPYAPYFGYNVFTPNLKAQWEQYYKDEMVLAFPTPDSGYSIAKLGEKALYIRHPYSSVVGTLANMPEADKALPASEKQIVLPDKVVELTSLLSADGSIQWNVPKGNWTILRMGMCNNGAITRPAPDAGLGFECDKFDTMALEHHFNKHLGTLLAKSGFAGSKNNKGLTSLHMDSWEMGAANWSNNFRTEFHERRGYDPYSYLPVLGNIVVGSAEISERFLWDIRQTAMELVLQNHAMHLKKKAHQLNLNFSIEPYDMNPCSDLDLGATADVPACEFWNKGKGYPTAYSCIEAASIAHVMGKPVVMAEAFTSDWEKERYVDYPTSLKNEGDWAFCIGVNSFFYHTFAHKAWLGNDLLPGMAMGGFGVHWDRGQTWWNMSGEYHKYIARCSYVLRNGISQADILYLTPEGAPDVFRAPPSAFFGNPDTMPDKKGFAFDACSPLMLINYATVKDGKIIFPGGGCYQVMVLPLDKSMTPGLIKKIKWLVIEGATIIGSPPVKSPGLSNYPQCDNEVASISHELWGNTNKPQTPITRKFGKGRIFWGGSFTVADSGSLYPSYQTTEKVLKDMGLKEEFTSNSKIRYCHRTTDSTDIWFVSNKTSQSFKATCAFRSSNFNSEVWNPVTGECFSVKHRKSENGITNISLQFDAYQSFFVVFNKKAIQPSEKNTNQNLPEALQTIQILKSPWEVCFDPKWGGPEKVVFDSLQDWTKRSEPGIKYYSGTAQYKTTFSFNTLTTVGSPVYLNLGEVDNMARIKLNGVALGVVWTAPWQVNISKALKVGENILEIEVVNLWPNRLIGDEEMPYDAMANGTWPSWLLNNTARSSGRYAFTPWSIFRKGEPLLKSGLIGPVKLMQ